MWRRVLYIINSRIVSGFGYTVDVKVKGSTFDFDSARTPYPGNFGHFDNFVSKPMIFDFTFTFIASNLIWRFIKRSLR